MTLRFVYPDSPAAKAGLKPGDRITAWEGKPVKSLEEFFEQLASFTAHQKAKLEVRRGDETLKLEVQLAALPETVPAELPRGHDPPPAIEGTKPATGVVKIKLPESKAECIAYVPENYNPKLNYGVVVWLHPPGGYKEEELVARWKDLCAKHDLILLAPKSSEPAKWQRTELEFVKKTLDDLSGKYHVDRARTVAAGQEGGGGMAYLFALVKSRSRPRRRRRRRRACRSALRSRRTIPCCEWRSTLASRKRTRSNRRSKRWPRGSGPKNTR